MHGQQEVQPPLFPHHSSQVIRSCPRVRDLDIVILLKGRDSLPDDFDLFYEESQGRSSEPHERV